MSHYYCCLSPFLLTVCDEEAWNLAGGVFDKKYQKNKEKMV
jgi:hypothetical protein